MSIRLQSTSTWLQLTKVKRHFWHSLNEFPRNESSKNRRQSSPICFSRAKKNGRPQNVVDLVQLWQLCIGEPWTLIDPDIFVSYKQFRVQFRVWNASLLLLWRRCGLRRVNLAAAIFWLFTYRFSDGKLMRWTRKGFVVCDKYNLVWIFMIEIDVFPDTMCFWKIVKFVVVHLNNALTCFNKWKYAYFWRLRA